MRRRLLLCLTAALAMGLVFRGDPEPVAPTQVPPAPPKIAAPPPPPSTDIGGGRRVVLEGDTAVLIEPSGERIVLGRLGERPDRLPPLPVLPLKSDPLYPPRTDLSRTQVVVVKTGLVNVPAVLLVTHVGDDHVIAFDPATRRATAHFVGGRVEPREKTP